MSRFQHTTICAFIMLGASVAATDTAVHIIGAIAGLVLIIHACTQKP